MNTMAANDHHPAEAGIATVTAASTVGPERVRSPRLVASPQPRLRSLLSRGYAGFTEATVPRRLVLPATASVPLVVKLADSPYRPPAFVLGAHDASAVLEGTCAPSYLEVILNPLGATPRSGCRWTTCQARQ
jgi:hypothetical protein